MTPETPQAHDLTSSPPPTILPRLDRPPVRGTLPTIGTWRSLVARLTGGQEVAGSNPVVPTGVTAISIAVVTTLSQNDT